MKLVIDRHDVALIVVALLEDIIHLECGVQDFEFVFIFGDVDVAATSLRKIQISMFL